MLAPAQFISGIENNCPSNIGFLAFNWYTQVRWYQAIKAKELHALSLLPVHFNLILAVTYLGGVSSGNVFMAALLGFGTAGVIVLNTVASWTSWATNLPEGFGEYRFFFFGWRTLNAGWHKFFLCWQIADSMCALGCFIAAIGIAFGILTIPTTNDSNSHEKKPWFAMWYIKYPAIPLGAIAILICFWPLILWTELIVARNHIESETDMIAVWLFVAQVGAMIVPSCSSCGKRLKSSPEKVGYLMAAFGKRQPTPTE